MERRRLAFGLVLVVAVAGSLLAWWGLWRGAPPPEPAEQPVTQLGAGSEPLATRPHEPDAHGHEGGGVQAPEVWSEALDARAAALLEELGWRIPCVSVPADFDPGPPKV